MAQTSRSRLRQLATSLAQVLAGRDASAGTSISLDCMCSTKAEFESSDRIEIDFAVTNSGTQDVSLLKWYTPLEGLKGDIFEVQRDDTRLRYSGVLMKRGDPTAADYITIAPGDTVRATVDLRDAYGIDDIGSYTVRLVSTLPDATIHRDQIPRPRADHEPYELDCDELHFAVHERRMRT